VRGVRVLERSRAGMAELVDARDLKVLATTEPPALSCKTVGPKPIETDGKRDHLQNSFGEFANDGGVNARAS